MKVYQTSKLYFGKWLYRIETTVPGASLIKHRSIDEVREFCFEDRGRMWGRQYTTNDKAQLADFLSVVEPFLKNDIKLRGEWNTLNFYLNDVNLYQDMATSLENWIISITEPASAADAEALHNAAQVLRDTLPHNKFQYRVYIRTSMPQHERIKLAKWLENYPDTVKTSKGTLKWMIAYKPFFQDPFIYVADRNQLMLVTLFLGGHLRNTQEFVLRNTVK
jgi:hypothetical protein